MIKVLKNIVLFVLHTVLAALILLVIFIRELFKGHNIVKLFVVLFFGFFTWAYLCAPSVFKIGVCVYFLISTLIAITVMRTPFGSESNEEMGFLERYENLFAGMTEADAKREYRKLMREYHPDNTVTGDKEMAQKIQADYESYKLQN